jgi:endonuclease/exonuclease/phosphatase family metal-dependent hydrolase
MLRRVLWMWAILAGVALCARRCTDPAPAPPATLRVATYNVRFFGRDPTDHERLRAVVSDVDPAVLALEELVRDESAQSLAASLSVRGRDYRLAAAQCGGRSGLRVAFLYDRSRVEWRGVREFAAMEPDGDGLCTEGDRAALAATFARKHAAPGEPDTTLVALHLAARSEPERVEQRRRQWRRLFAIRDRLAREGHARVLFLGDTNSTGWRDDAQGERSFIETEAARAGMTVETGALACSEYYRTGDRRWDPSMLDHVLAPYGTVVPGSARLHGYCAQLSCEPWTGAAPPAEYTHVSDHCPVSVELRW